MSSTFITLTFRLPREKELQLPEVLEAWPVLGCEVRDANGDVEVVLFLAGEEDGVLPQLKGVLHRFGARELAEGLQPEVDWLGAYRAQSKPFPVGQRFWIDPHPQTPTPPPPERLALLIEPRQAFGTGSHESTQLMLLVLEGHPPTGRRVLDVGTGSGILALAAKALGAAWVLGFDMDADAVFVAGETRRWHPQWPVALFAGRVKALRAQPTFHLVMANMLVEQVVPLLPHLARLLLPAGQLFLSGLLKAQEHAVASELESLGLEVVAKEQLGEWAALVAQQA